MAILQCDQLERAGLRHEERGFGQENAGLQEGTGLGEDAKKDCENMICNKNYKNIIHLMADKIQELERKVIEANKKFDAQVTQKKVLLHEHTTLQNKIWRINGELSDAIKGYKNMKNINEQCQYMVYCMKMRQQGLEQKLTAANQELDNKNSENTTLITALQNRITTLQNETGKMRMRFVNRENSTNGVMHDQIVQKNKLEASLTRERINVAIEKKNVETRDEDIAKLKMQVAEAGNGKMVMFLLELIERKERSLECPVCMEVAAPPILCCSEQHLICSSCQPQLRECPECRFRYDGRQALRRHRHAEGVAEEVDGLKEQLRQFTS